MQQASTNTCFKPSHSAWLRTTVQQCQHCYLPDHHTCQLQDQFHLPSLFPGLPCGSASKECTCNAGDLSLIPGLGRSPGGGKGNSGLKISMDCLVHGVTKSRIQLSDFHLHHSSFWGKPLCSRLWKERFAGFGSDNGSACWLCFWVTQIGLNWEVNLVVSFLKLSHTHFLPFLSHFQWTYSQIAGSDKNDMYYAF